MHNIPRSMSPDSTFEVSNNAYDALQISREASRAEIRAAFRELALNNHPDKQPGEEALPRFRDAAKAHKILTDQEKKVCYDHALTQFERESRRAKKQDAGSALRTGRDQPRHRTSGMRGNVPSAAYRTRPAFPMPRHSQVVEEFFPAKRRVCRQEVRKKVVNTVKYRTVTRKRLVPVAEKVHIGEENFYNHHNGQWYTRPVYGTVTREKWKNYETREKFTVPEIVEEVVNVFCDVDVLVDRFGRVLESSLPRGHYPDDMDDLSRRFEGSHF